MEMTDQHKEFLHLCVVEQMSYEDISKKLNLPRKTITSWYEDLKEERIKIAEVRNLWNRKKITISFNDFYTWYISHERKCYYCEITEQEIKELLDSEKLATKRID